MACQYNASEESMLLEWPQVIRFVTSVYKIQR